MGTLQTIEAVENAIHAIECVGLIMPKMSEKMRNELREALVVLAAVTRSLPQLSKEVAQAV